MGNEIITTIVDAIAELGVGLGSSIVDIFNSLFVNAEGNLNNIAIWALTFVGLGFTFGLVRWLTRKL